MGIIFGFQKAAAGEGLTPQLTLDFWEGCCFAGRVSL